jgi:hypothetical protein
MGYVSARTGQQTRSVSLGKVEPFSMGVEALI